MSYSFYKEKEFVNTQKGAYPNAWKIDKFDSFMTLEYGKGLSESMRREGSYPVFGSNGIIGYHDEKLVNSPGIVVGRKGTIGAVTQSLKDFWPIDTTFYVKLKSEEIDWNWLYYELVHLNLPKLSSADVVPGLKRELVNNLTFPLPSLAEQKKIAGVLGVVDSAIEYADRIIAGSERLKRGLMQQLLTHGIGHKEYKQTTVGKIPKEWQIVELKEILDVLSGQYFKFSEFTNKGVRCLKIDNVGFGEVVWDGTTLLPSAYLKDYPELALKDGDIVLALNRPIIGGKVKVGMVTTKDTPSILYQRVGKVILKDSSKVESKFLLSIFTSENFKNQLKQSLVGTDQPYIRTPILLKIKIPLPPKNEQQKIVEIFSNINRKLWLEQQERARSEKIRRGLMDLLLTGKVRIRVD